MILRYIKLSISNMLKHKVDSIVNLTGLAIGAACFMLILQYVQFEYSYDTPIPNHERICRVVSDVPEQSGGMMRSCMTSGAFTRMLDENFPEVIVSTRCTPSFETLVEIDNKRYYESHAWYVDSTFLKVFPFQLLKGNEDDVLSGSMKVVISEKIAKKYFGDEDPLNKQLKWGNRWDYTVSGVFRDLPDNLHIDIDFLATPDSINGFQQDFWGRLNLFSYILLEENVSTSDLEQKFYDFTVETMGEAWADVMQFKLQPLDDIHLKSDRIHEVAKTADEKQLAYLLIVAVIIIAMALINFMNLYTARSEYRSKEVGVRKVIGSIRINLITQFLTEAIVYSLFATAFALVLLGLVWKYYIGFIEVDIPFNLIAYLPYIGLFILLSGIIAGIYPAVYLSSFNPVESIKSLFRVGKTSTNTRKVLVIIQIGLSVFMIIATIVIEMQMKYVREKDLGFDKEMIVSFRLRDNLGHDLDRVKNEFESIPGVKGVTASSARLGNILSGQRSYYLPNEGDDPRNDFMLRTMFVDKDYITQYDMHLLEGRNFSEEFGTDPTNALIVNEAAVKRIGFENPLGKQLLYRNRQDSVIEYTIIGVLKDFHYQSLHQEVDPILLRFSTNGLYNLSIKVDGSNLKQTLADVEAKWNEFLPAHPFRFQFLNDELSELYDKESKISTIYLILTMLTIFISCLGLYGITSFILEKRTKEIGVRKVLGAQPTNLLYHLSKELVMWLCIANVISWPLSYMFIRKWLQSFAFHIELSWWIFPMSLFVVTFIALVTISYNTYKASVANPVESLRYE